MLVGTGGYGAKLRNHPLAKALLTYLQRRRPRPWRFSMQSHIVHPCLWKRGGANEAEDVGSSDGRKSSLIGAAFGGGSFAELTVSADQVLSRCGKLPGEELRASPALWTWRHEEVPILHNIPHTPVHTPRHVLSLSLFDRALHCVLTCRVVYLSACGTRERGAIWRCLHFGVHFSVVLGAPIVLLSLNLLSFDALRLVTLVVTLRRRCS